MRNEKLLQESCRSFQHILNKIFERFQDLQIGQLKSYKDFIFHNITYSETQQLLSVILIVLLFIPYNQYDYPDSTSYRLLQQLWLPQVQKRSKEYESLHPGEYFLGCELKILLTQDPYYNLQQQQQQLVNKKMSSDMCCAIPINMKQYQLITSRLLPFDIKFAEIKHFQISLYQPAIKKPSDTKKINSRKFQSTIVSLSDKNSSIYLIGNSNQKNFDNKFVTQANFFRTQNNFKGILKNWDVFTELKQVYTYKVQSETYLWGKAFQLQFVQLNNDPQKDQIILVMRDFTSSNFLNIIQKMGKSDNQRIQIIKIKIFNHFKQIYAMLCNTYHEGIQDPNLYNQIGQHSRHTHPKILQLEQKIRRFAEKLYKYLTQKTNNYHNIYWMAKAGTIIEFVLNKYIKQQKQIKKKQ